MAYAACPKLIDRVNILAVNRSQINRVSLKIHRDIYLGRYWHLAWMPWRLQYLW